MTMQETHTKLAGLIVLIAMVVAACSGGSEAATELTSAPATTADSAATAAEVTGDVDDSAIADSSGGNDAVTSTSGGDVPDDLPFPIPEGGGVFNYLDDPSEPVLTMEYAGDRSTEFVIFYEDWIASEPAASGNPTDTGVGTLFTVTIDGAVGIISVNVAPTGDITGVTLGWPRSGDATQSDAAAGGDAAPNDAAVMAAADLPADPPAPFPTGGEVNKFGEFEAGYSLTLTYKGTHRKEFVAFYESWATDVGAETTSSEDGALGHAFEFELDGQPVIVDVKGGEPPAGLTMVTVLWRRP